MKIEVCMGSACILKGAMTILDQLEELQEFIEENSEEYTNEVLEIEAVKCLDYCKKTDKKITPVVVVDGDVIFRATGQDVMGRVMKKLKL